MIIKSLRSRKGSMVVEASIVVPVVILCIFAVLYLAILMYQKVYLQTLADKAAQKGAVMWCNKYRDMEMGKLTRENLNGGGLYWRWAVFDASGEEKKEKVKEYINYRIDRFSLLSSITKVKSKRVDVCLKDYIIYKKLIVTIEDTYKIPVGNLLRLFGLESRYSIKVKSEAVINEPTEFIRNADFMVDTERELEERHEGIKISVGKARDTIEKIKDKIINFKLY